mgnify:CR=1 FL=1
MSKSKYITIKELPFAWYEVDALEAWLDEQSQQGLQLVGIRGFSFGYKRAVFAESGEFPTRYRVHIKPKDGYYTVPELPGIGQEMSEFYIANAKKVVIE